MSMKPSIDELKSDLREFHGYIMKSQEFIEKVQNNELGLSAHAMRISEQEKKHETTSEDLGKLQAETDDLDARTKSMSEEIADVLSKHDAFVTKNTSEFRTVHARIEAVEANNRESIEAVKKELEMLRERMSRNMIIQSILLGMVVIAAAVAVYMG